MCNLHKKESTGPQAMLTDQDLNLQIDFEEEHVYDTLLWKWNGAEYPLFSVYCPSILPFGCLALPQGFSSGLVLSNSRPQVGSICSSFDNSSAELGLKPETGVLENSARSPWTSLRQLRLEPYRASGTCNVQKKEPLLAVPLLQFFSSTIFLFYKILHYFQANASVWT